MAHQLGTSQSFQNLSAWPAYPPRRLPHSASSVSLLLPRSTSYQSFGNGSRVRSSGTWTSSSGEFGLLSHADEVDDRDVFVQEYNRLAQKHGVRRLNSDDFEAHQQSDVCRCAAKRGWLARILRPISAQCPHVASPLPPPPQLRHKHSVSELAQLIHCRRVAPKIIEIQDMVRLSGKSMLYLPQEYAPCSLILPTCIRATAQYLAQNVTTRGIFRVPGSSKVISALFDYYCFENTNPNISGTVRCATLPIHIQHSVHDVASTFKRLLAVLPGGILGSLGLLDSFIAIHSQLNGEPEYPRTKQTKVRARLIALAIGTIKSQYRREMICAVFGLLSLIGRVAEVAPREDEDSRPLPTADLMGYNALGIVFGPLLVGDLLDQYTMKVATPSSGMLLFPLSPSRFRKERRKSIQINTKTPASPAVDKILVVNSITEMLIANWRDVVRQMRSLGTNCRKDQSSTDLVDKNDQIQPPQGFNTTVPGKSDQGHDRGTRLKEGNGRQDSAPARATHALKDRRLNVLRRATSQRLAPKMSIATLSPTKEESMGDDESSDGNEHQKKRRSVIQRLQKADKSQGNNGPSPMPAPRGKSAPVGALPSVRSTQVYLESVPPRESSKQNASYEGTDGHVPPADSQGTINPRRSLVGTKSNSDDSRQEPVTKQPSKSYVVPEGVTNRSPACGSTASPLLNHPKSMLEGGIRMVQKCCSQDLSAAKSQISSASLGTTPSYVPQDQGVQCNLFANRNRQNSMEITPERFYAHEKTLASVNNGLAGDLQEAQPPRKETTAMHQPRVSRSYDQLRTQATKSPTESTNSKELRKHGSVKAMAAMFETQTAGRQSPALSELPTTTPKGSKRYSRDRQSKSDSAWTHQTPEPSVGPLESKSSKSNPKVSGMQLHQVVRGILNARLKEASVLGETDNNVQDSDSGYSPSKMLKESGVDGTDEKALKAVPNLGRMVPCREQPAIAQYLNLARPHSTPSPVHESEPCQVLGIASPTPEPRPRSATVLYSQIRNLQRQLNAKSEEAIQLRRQLEAQKNSDVGTVSEQLRQAKRDAAMWKERAETAERRVKVFEKISEKLKDIRHAVGETSLGKEIDGHSGSEPPVGDNFGGQRASADMEVAQMTDVEDISKTDDKTAAVAAANVRHGPQGLSATQDGTLDSDPVSSIGGDEQNEQGCSTLPKMGMGQGAERIWILVEELLQLQGASGM